MPLDLHRPFGELPSETFATSTIALIVLVLSDLIHARKFSYIGKKYNRGAVVTNGIGCAEAGIELMERGGNAVDVALATLFCEGVVMPSTMGLGGGFFMTIFNSTTKEVMTLDARETAPKAATEDMFSGNPDLSITGGLSVAVPGELRGYWKAYNTFGGGVPWHYLMQNAIKRCKNGISVNPFTASMLARSKNAIYNDPGLRKVFINPSTNDIYKEGDIYKRPTLARTLEVIAKEGGDALHDGSLTKQFVKDIQNMNGIITIEDMNEYRTKLKKPVHTKVFGKEFYSFPLPASGPVLAYILNILEDFLNPDEPFSLINYQRMTESLKFEYGARTKLGDGDFVDLETIVTDLLSKRYAAVTRTKIFDHWTSQDPEYYGAISGSEEDHGTANICVFTPNGDAVSVTSSINYIFGAKFMSESTGIILNDSMDDFSRPGEVNQYGLPPSPANFIVPNKRPMSSMTPTIILDEHKDVSMVIGGAGGSRITSNVAQVIINFLLYGLDLKTASDQDRIHHQLFPMLLSLESEFLENNLNVVDGLSDIGHNITFVDSDGFAAVTCLSREKRSVVGVTDKRRRGSVSYLN